jgi:hypothetical protein
LSLFSSGEASRFFDAEMPFTPVQQDVFPLFQQDIHRIEPKSTEPETTEFCTIENY